MLPTIEEAKKELEIEPETEEEIAIKKYLSENGTEKVGEK